MSQNLLKNPKMTFKWAIFPQIEFTANVLYDWRYLAIFDFKKQGN